MISRLAPISIASCELAPLYRDTITSRLRNGDGDFLCVLYNSIYSAPRSDEHSCTVDWTSTNHANIPNMRPKPSSSCAIFTSTNWHQPVSGAFSLYSPSSDTYRTKMLRVASRSMKEVRTFSNFANIELSLRWHLRKRQRHPHEELSWNGLLWLA